MNVIECKSSKLELKLYSWEFGLYWHFDDIRRNYDLIPCTHVIMTQKQKPLDWRLLDMDPTLSRRINI